MVPIHRLTTDELSPWQADDRDWALIKLAADMSKVVYEDKIECSPGAIVHKMFKGGASMKPAVVSTHLDGDKKVLVVAIRGTVTTDDWMLNVNGEPEVSEAFDKTTQWHRGFLRMTLKMQKEVARVVEEVASQNDTPEQILFTGHSAGGAIAQILYALSMRNDSVLSRAIQGISTVHCVTFAAPPVSQPPIAPCPTQGLQHSNGKFFAVVNEGDPVPLAQKEYILALLEVYAKTTEALENSHLDRFTVPIPVLKLSGQCLLLRDEDPTRWEDLNIRAYGVDASILQSKLFGNPLEHNMIEYWSRIYRILGQLPAEKGMDIDL